MRKGNNQKEEKVERCPNWRVTARPKEEGKRHKKKFQGYGTREKEMTK